MSANLVRQLDKISGLLSLRKIPSEAEFSYAITELEAMRKNFSGIVEKAEVIFSAFVNVRAKSQEYAQALKASQNEAQAMLRNISEVCIDDIIQMSEVCEAFLSAINMENIPSDLAPLEQYPGKVLVGVIGHQYYLADAEQETAPDDEEYFILKIADEPAIQQETVQVKPEHSQITVYRPSFISDDEVEEVLFPVNRIKTGKPSASSFKNDMKNLAIGNRYIRTLLPLLTHIGAMTKDQAYFFCLCMNWMPDSVSDKAKLETCIDVLAQKGYIAHYEYGGKDIYCLTVYTFTCMEKKSIAEKMTGFWRCSFGENIFGGRDRISSFFLKSMCEANYALLLCLHYEVDKLNEMDFHAVMNSIKFTSGNYDIDIVYQGEIFRCTLLVDLFELHSFDGANVIVICGEGELPEKISPNIHVLFVLSFDRNMVRYSCLDGEKVMVSQDIRSEVPDDIDDDETFFKLKNADFAKYQSAENVPEDVPAIELSASPQAKKTAGIRGGWRKISDDSQAMTPGTGIKSKAVEVPLDPAPEDPTPVVPPRRGRRRKAVDAPINPAPEDHTPAVPPRRGRRRKAAEAPLNPEPDGQVPAASPATSTVYEYLQTLLEVSDAPSDEAFCSIINYLLDRQATTFNELRSVIVQSVLLANGAALEKDRPMAESIASQLKLASHLLTEDAPYSSAHLASVFNDPEKSRPEFLLSAYLLAMLTPSAEYDYGLQDQTRMFFTRFDDYFGAFPAFKPLFSRMLSVAEASTRGFSAAVIAMIGSEAEKEAFFDSMKSEAESYLKVPSPKTRMKSLPPMYNNCFGPESDLYSCMKIIADGKNDTSSVEFVEAVLDEYCKRQNDTFTPDRSRLDARIDEEWDKNNSGNKFKLTGIAREHAIRHFTLRLELMALWHEQTAAMAGNSRKDLSKLRSLKQEILSLCSDIQEENGTEYPNILLWVLSFIQKYLNGEISRLGIYSELLLTGAIPLNDDGSPDIDSSMAEIRYYEPWRNALRHILAEKRSLEEVKAEILGDNIDDDTPGLKDNLHQLEMLGKITGSTDDDYVITESQRKEAADSADERAEHFRDTLELAYTYSQINEIEKENLSGIMARYRDDFYSSMNFAGWRCFLEALERQIKEFAETRKSVLEFGLDARLAKNPDSELLREAERLLMEDMNLAVAEEYLNRYDAGETKIDEGVLHENDYFADFLAKENFDRLLQECRRNEGRALKNFGWKYLERNFPKDWTSKHRDNSKKLIESWPSRKDTASTEQIKTLFTCLGFKVTNVLKKIGSKEEIFQITAEPEPKSKADYRHPIAAFGTQLKSPVNVIILYGNFMEKQLVDTVSSLDLGGISIVLVDTPIEAARRRLIGEIFHTQTSGQNRFLLIDQVLFLYLACHQDTERLPALLECTLPYTTYQPFVRDGGATADEMFFGRTQELATLIDPNGACVVYGGRQLGKTALLERVASRCSKPEERAFAVYSSIVKITDEAEVVSELIDGIARKTEGTITLNKCSTLKEMCAQLSNMFMKGKIVSMHLLIDEVDSFIDAISDQAYRPLQPLVDLKRETKNNFKFVIAGLHNVCRARNATRENGIFGQLGTPLCIRPLSPTDAFRLLSRPLKYLGFQIGRYSHLETILTNTNYYPGIVQFFGYMLVQTLNGQYSKYYHAADGNPPFMLQNEHLGSVMNSSDLNKSIKDKFRWSLELDRRYFMLARCIAVLYHCYLSDIYSGSWLGFKTQDIIDTAEAYGIHCLKNISYDDYVSLLDEMEEMGILSRPETGMYRLRRSSFVDIIGENIDVLEHDIAAENLEG
ncbi:MAG: hypothetical protein IJR85_11220 [Synergistaceae bacterium]|nr:hypothetical protein [Synergistaceae bacterium]